MKRLNKIILIISLASVNAPIFAQTFGIRGGLNVSKAAIKEEGSDLNLYNTAAFAFHLGGTAEFEIKAPYKIETGLIFNFKGYRLPVDGGTDTVTHLFYLDIPVNLKYGFSLGKNKLNLMAGPFIGFGITGSNDYKRDGEVHSKKVKWGNNKENDDFRRLDYGINVGAEYEFRRFGIGLQCQLGLANILAGGDSDNSQRNRLASIYFAYKFGR